MLVMKADSTAKAFVNHSDGKMLLPLKVYLYFVQRFSTLRGKDNSVHPSNPIEFISSPQRNIRFVSQ